jgi:SAM-dependent methyltransferase
MMFGTREEFAYLECGTCGCVQILRYPDNVSEYYPPDYYSFDTSEFQREGNPHGARGKRHVKEIMLGWFPIARRLYLSTASTRRWLASHPGIAAYVKRMESPAARILDVGCGSGSFLRILRDFYYKNAFGIDPFITADVRYLGRLLVRKADLYELNGRFDCISFNHSLEHMPDQLRVLMAARELLAPGGFLLIRIPVAGCQAWRTYRENWVQLDAPRHFYLHSRASIKVLATEARLRVDSISDDSTGLQFWGSELYRRGVPLIDPQSPMTPGGSMFTSQQLEEYASRAAKLNAVGDGDQVIVILRDSEERGACL